MAIYLLGARPQIGKENKNVEDIITQLSFLPKTEEVLMITPQNALMGLGDIYYQGLGDFESRQTKAVLELQQRLFSNQTVIISLWNKEKQDYDIKSVKKSEIENIDKLFLFRDGDKSHRIAFFSSFPQKEEELKLGEKIDLVFLMESFPFESAPSSPSIVSLSSLEPLYTQKLEKRLNILSVKTGSTSFTLPIFGQYQGKLWDGVFGFCDFSLKSHAFASSPYQSILLSDTDYKPKEVRKPSQLMLERILELLCEQIRFYGEQVKAKGVVIGLSGGIDSALIAALATLSLGSERVLGVLMPGPFSSSHSISDSKELCENLEISYKQNSIVPLYEEVQKTLGDMSLCTLSLENLQARLRGLLLMSYSNQMGLLALNTCNKSEDMVGYATLYGDAIGAFAPIGDLYKTQVYELAKYINTRSRKVMIPLSILEKEPSAELREDQKDTDSLPSYDLLDSFLQSVIEYGEDAQKTGEKLGFSEKDSKRLLRQIFSSQYKRKQAPQVFRISAIEKAEIRERWSQDQYWL